MEAGFATVTDFVSDCGTGSVRLCCNGGRKKTVLVAENYLV